MDAPLGEQIVSLIATLAALVVAGLAVAAVMFYGLPKASGYLGIGLVTFGLVRLVIGQAIRPRATPTPAEPTAGD